MCWRFNLELFIFIIYYLSTARARCVTVKNNASRRHAEKVFQIRNDDKRFNEIKRQTTIQPFLDVRTYPYIVGTYRRGNKSSLCKRIQNSEVNR